MTRTQEKTASAMTTRTTLKRSRNLIAEWHGRIKIAIWEECRWKVRLYEDRALVDMPEQTPSRVESNSWYLDEHKYRITDAKAIEHLKRLAESGAEASAVLRVVALEIYPLPESSRRRALTARVSVDEARNGGGWGA